LASIALTWSLSMAVTILPTEIQISRSIRGDFQRHVLHLTSRKNPNHKRLILNDKLTNILSSSKDINIFICKKGK
jgi:hypothetical protein